MKATASKMHTKAAPWFQRSFSCRYRSAKPLNTSRVTTSWITFSSAAEYTVLPQRLAGTMKMYSKKAMPQLSRITFQSGSSVPLLSFE